MAGTRRERKPDAGGPWPQKTACVVLGVSQSSAGLQALRYAVAEASHRRTQVRAVRVWGFEPPWKGPEVARYQEEFAVGALRYIALAFEMALVGQPHDVDVILETPNDRVDRALVTAAGDPTGLLVLGGRVSGRRPSALVRLCLRGAACPVTVVPPPDLGVAHRRNSVRKLLREISRHPEMTGPHLSHP
jgi:hypothetical protein